MLEHDSSMAYWDDVTADARGRRTVGWNNTGRRLPRRITVPEATSGSLDGLSPLALRMGLTPAFVEREGLYLWLDEAAGKLRPCEAIRCWKSSCLIRLLGGSKAQLKTKNSNVFYFPD